MLLGTRYREEVRDAAKREDERIEAERPARQNRAAVDVRRLIDDDFAAIRIDARQRALLETEVVPFRMRGAVDLMARRVDLA